MGMEQGMRRLRRWWRRGPLWSPRPAAAPPNDRIAPRIPAEYASLYTYLGQRYATSVVLTFEQMESLLGFALPAPAWTERDWWGDAAVHMDGHTAAWVGAGRIATPNLSARTVTFERSPDRR